VFCGEFEVILNLRAEMKEKARKILEKSNNFWWKIEFSKF
jgi:hypothetical protein